jgi:apolipoprotein N-acyltransferase
LATARSVALIVIAAVALNLMQPPLLWWPAAFVGCAALYELWSSVSPVKAAVYGALAGFICFAVTFSWIGDTAGSLLGRLAFLFDAVPALIETPAFVAAAVAMSLLRKRSGIASAAGSAAAFALFEYLRGIGVLGAPLAKVGVAVVDSPLAAVAMYAGTAGVTFVVFLLGALAVIAITRKRERPAALALIACVVCLVAAANGARPIEPLGEEGTTVVAAVQGDVNQLVKWTSSNYLATVQRYGDMTRALPDRPALIVWPETAIPANLTDPREVLVRRYFAGIARESNAMLIVGAVSGTPQRYYNSLFFYGPDGKVVTIYRKRQLVPFSEALPADWLRVFPIAKLASHYSHGVEPTVVPFRGLSIGPLICWEAGFEDVVHTQIQRGADVWSVSTDDAWFGDRTGPYEQTQIAQMLALETGRYVVRSAATGISGIIAPDGRFTIRTPLNVETNIVGGVGPARATLFARIGPAPVAWVLVLIFIAAFAAPRRPHGTRTSA